ncbi:MAG: AraC family transcriptional regulator [Lachnospiraceae bacterium]|nr:AraC family transcriptional regulator [Lachnospiraceae bacterium]
MSMFNPAHRYVTITAFYAVFLEEYDMPVHTHASCEIMYITKGNCRIYAGQKEYRLKEDQFILLDAETPHRLWIPKDSPCSLLNLEFLCRKEKTSLDLWEPKKGSASFDLFCRSQKTVWVSNDTGHLGYALKDLIFQLEQKVPYSRNGEMSRKFNSADADYLIRLLFFRTMMELSRCSLDNGKTTGALHLKKALSYISAHLTENIRIPELAAYIGINKSYLQSLFARHMHCTVTDYINRRRLEQAAFLLANSSLSVTDIAFRTGYNSRQYFGSVFEKYYGTNPRAYRQLHEKRISTSTGHGQYVIRRDGTWDTEPLE